MTRPLSTFRLIPPLLLVLILVTLALFPRYDAEPLSVDVNEGDAHIYFEAASRAVPFSGDCVMVRWNVEGIRTVSLNGLGTVGTGEQQVCLTDETRPVQLDIEFQDGTQRTYTLPIEILSHRPIYFVLLASIWLLLWLVADLAHERWLADRIALRPLMIGVCLTPLALFVYAVYFFHGSTLTDYVPLISDEIMYWHQALTFREAGFNGGYYTVGEQTASFEWSHFYSWGPMYPLIYGGIARLVGWELYTAPLLNLTFITLALGLLLANIRLSRPQLLFIIALMLTCWAILWMLSATMQEALHLALAIGLAWGFYKLLQGNAATTLKLTMLLLLVVAALLRYSWGLLFLPYFLLLLQPLKLTRVLLAFVLAAVMIVFTTGLSVGASAPYPTDVDIGGLAQRGIAGAVEVLISIVVDNLGRFINGDANSQSLRYQTLALIVIAGAFLITAQRRRSSFNEMGFHLLNLGGILVANLIFTLLNDYRDYRVIAPHMLLSLILLVLYHRRWIVSAVIVCNLLLLPAALQFLTMRGVNYYFASELITELRREWSDILVYDPNAVNAWCNTVDLPPRVSWEYLAVPAGIGTTRISLTQLPLRARWIVVNNQSSMYTQVQAGETNLEWLATTPLGELYRNPDADCEPRGA